MSVKKSYGCIASLLQTALPGFADSHILGIDAASNFNFGQFTSVKVQVLSLKRENGVWNILIISEDPDIVLNKSKLLYACRDRLSLMGEPVLDSTLEDKGMQNLTQFGEGQKKNTVILTAQTRGNRYYIALTYDLFTSSLRVCGLGFRDELSLPYFVQHMPVILDKLETALLSENNLMYMSFETLLQKMHDKDGSFLLNHLLKNQAYDHNFLASLSLLFKRVRALTAFFSQKNRAILDKKTEHQKSCFNDPSDILRWKQQIEYFMLGLLNRYIFEDNAEVRIPGLDVHSFYGLPNKLTSCRLFRREQSFPLNDLIRFVARSKTIYNLISADAKNTMAELAAFDAGVDFKPLYEFFSDNFSSDLENRIRQEASKNKNLPDAERLHRVNVCKNKMYMYLEKDADFFSQRENNAEPDFENFLSIIRAGSGLGIYHIFQKLGYIHFTEIFEAFRYFPVSSPDQTKEDVFFHSISNMLMNTERSITEDIYYERLNTSRIINAEVLHKRMMTIYTRIKSLHALKYLE